jgi:hypothetical protein
MNDLRETITRCLATIARFGADAVMLVMRCVPLTLRAAHAASFSACGELRANEIEVRVSLSRHDLSRRLTDDGAMRQSLMLVMSLRVGRNSSAMRRQPVTTRARHKGLKSVHCE